MKVQLEEPVQLIGLPPVTLQSVLAVQLRFVGCGINRLPKSMLGSDEGSVPPVTWDVTPLLLEASASGGSTAKPAVELVAKAESRMQIVRSRFKVVIDPPRFLTTATLRSSPGRGTSKRSYSRAQTSGNDALPDAIAGAASLARGAVVAIVVSAQHLTAPAAAYTLLVGLQAEGLRNPRLGRKSKCHDNQKDGHAEQSISSHKMPPVQGVVQAFRVTRKLRFAGAVQSCVSGTRNRSMHRALPVVSSMSMRTAASRTSRLATSKDEGVWRRKRLRTLSVRMPMTDS